MSESVSPGVHALAAACGATTAELITIPFCTIRTNQIDSHQSIYQVVKRLLHHTGPSAFYRGTSFSILSQVCSTTTKYSTYRWLQQNFQDEGSISNTPSTLTNVFHGSVSGVLGSVLTHPVDVSKICRQKGQAPRLEWQQACAVGRPLSFLYRGYSKSFVKNAILYALLYPTYDAAKRYTSNSVVLASLASACTTSIVLYPIDYWKVRHMAGHTERPRLRDMYRGYSMFLARVIPHMILTMTITEQLTAFALLGYKN